MIEIKGKTTVQLDHESIILQLYSFFEIDVAFFKILRDILFIYSEVSLFDMEDFEIEKEVNSRNHPSLKKSEEDAFYKLIEHIYLTFDQEGFKKFRGELTEFLAAKTGPFFVCSPMILTREVIFLEESQLLQPIEGEEFNHNFDLCFHEKDKFTDINEVTCEVLECKVKLENFFRSKLLLERPIKKKDKQDRNKIKFMVALENYFSSSKLFKIAFTTLSLNVDYQQQWLKKFPALNVEIVCANMIGESIERKLL